MWFNWHAVEVPEHVEIVFTDPVDLLVCKVYVRVLGCNSETMPILDAFTKLLLRNCMGAANQLVIVGIEVMWVEL